MTNRNTYGGKFCSPDERQITTIGTGYIANFLSGGGAEQAGATLTNKRIYFSGKVFTLNDKGHLSSVKQRKIVNVRDVTGVGYIQHNPIQYVILGLLALIAGIITLALTMEQRGGGWGQAATTSPSSIGMVGITVGILAFVVLIALFFLYRVTLLSI